jgi:hypothetical protein
MPDTARSPRAAAAVAPAGCVSSRRRRLSALLPVAWLLGACAAPLSLEGPAVAELPAPVPDWIATRLTEADDGRSVALGPGAAIAVSLRVQAASGVGWLVTAAPEGLVLTGRFTGPVWPPGATDSAVTPAPLWQVFVFEARAAAIAPGRLVFELRGGPDAPRPRRVSIGISLLPT